ncbi:sacsin N-terminal ATP-binding-like domain-containing protein [Mucilaginibacter sp. McL0603]|uniref:sacsin N-terminal ATP-binding-like domain-containing protein n=1 Tax=Mucilaginibacter sp. McL0603 TaxID=3415670 RepID=UPI003CED5163
MSPKQFIDELFMKRSVYADPDQAQLAVNLLHTVSTDIYSESQRFVFELIQNADDAAPNTGNDVYFDFIDDALIVSHNGKAFSDEDIKSLTNAGSSTKKADPTKTGYKGIGFKSVFGKSERVSIFSNGYQFRFEKNYHAAVLPWQVIPIWTEISEMSEDIQKSLSENPFLVNTVIETEKTDELEKELKELLADGQILLFLRRVKKIAVSRDGGDAFTIEKRIRSIDEGYNSVSLLINGREISTWIVKTFENIVIPESTKRELKKDDKTPDKLKEADFTELSFAVQIVDSKIKALGRDESLIFTYLPTKVSNFYFPFLLNGSFLTNAPREALHEDRIWNQWLMKLTAEKIVQWLRDLAGSVYKFELLQLLPATFGATPNELKSAFNSALEKSVKETAFIPSLTSVLMKPADLIIDNTGLSALTFIDPVTVIEFINRQQGTNFTEHSFVHNSVQHKEILERWGATVFDIDWLEPFFLSNEFTDSHSAAENFSLITYFSEKSRNDTSGKWKERLKEIPFIITADNELRNPGSVCFPSVAYQTEFGGSVTVIDPDVYIDIENDPPTRNWLEQMGVKDPSDEAYLENELIGNIETAVTENNYLQVTRYLFDKHKKGELLDEHYEKLKDLRLSTTAEILLAAKRCYLANFYEPVLRLEQVNNVCRYVSTEYKRPGDMVSEWKTFLLKLGVVQDIQLQVISLKPDEAREKYIDFTTFFDENRTQKYNSYGGGVYHNPITKYRLTTYSLLEFSTGHEFSKLFWERVVKTNFKRGTEDTGIANWQNTTSLQVNFFNWCIKNAPIFPTSLNNCELASEVFLNDKETMDVAGKFLPVFDYTEPLSEDWKKLLGFKKQLTLEDYLSVLEKMADQMEEGELLSKADQKRLGQIYNKLETLTPDLSADHKELISVWAEKNHLPATNLKFEPIKQLKLVKIAGFNTSSEKLKVMLLPENCKTNTPEFEAMVALFDIQIIDQFIPSFGQEPIIKELSLKRKLWAIIPFLAAVSERKRFADFENEFKRIKAVIERTDFFIATEIKLTFKDEEEIIEGTSLTIYRAANKLYFKGKWKSPLTMFVLIPELISILDIRNLNDELRLLLELDEEEITDYFISMGFNLQRLEFQEVKQELPFDDSAEEIVTAKTELYSDVERDDDINHQEQESTTPFTPHYPASSLATSSLTVQKRSFWAASNAPTKEYAEIASEGVRSDIGYWSEELVYNFLIQQQNDFSSIVWANEHEESGFPYDISYVESGINKFIDVKGTPSNEKDVLYLSDKEWVFMFKMGANYSLYRVYRAGFANAHVITVDNPAALIQTGEVLPYPITLKI